MRVVFIIMDNTIRTANKAIAVVLETLIDFMGMSALNRSFNIDPLFVYDPTVIIRYIDSSIGMTNSPFDALVFNNTHDECYRETSNG